MELHIDNLLVSAQVQIDRLKNSILFLKAGVVDPYLMDTEELSNAMVPSILNYNFSSSDIDLLLSQSKPVAAYDPRSNMIHIIFTVPTASQFQYKLYENFVIPKMVNSQMTILSNIPRYFAVSNDNRVYFYTEELNCFKVNKEYICKTALTFDVRMKRDCITDIFLSRH